jgi:predicted alpha/beta hydrolase family esterase
MEPLSPGKVVILPGLGNSGPGHWQTIWEKSNPNFSRIEHTEWDHPSCAAWIDTLEKTVSANGPNTFLAAHSLACLLIAHWATVTQSVIRGALLVAPPDPDSNFFPSSASSFANFPKTKFAFPSILVGSENDVYGSIQFAKECAANWGSEFVNAGRAGHINPDSGYGPWQMGEHLLEKLVSTK